MGTNVLSMVGGLMEGCKKLQRISSLSETPLKGSRILGPRLFPPSSWGHAGHVGVTHQYRNIERLPPIKTSSFPPPTCFSLFPTYFPG